MPDLLQVDKDVYKAVRRRDMDLTPSQQEVIRMNLRYAILHPELERVPWGTSDGMRNGILRVYALYKYI